MTPYGPRDRQLGLEVPWIIDKKKEKCTKNMLHSRNKKAGTAVVYGQFVSPHPWSRTWALWDRQLDGQHTQEASRKTIL